MTRTVHIIPHTHWDREWYRTFQSFRMELVDLVDETMALLEGDPTYAHFMLDGQMAVVDDYLEIRPSNLARIGRLAEAGRLVMGPWYILMDEFGVSGESIIRNLEMGLDRAEDFGGAMPIGYLPDMFGHIAQMPQILTQFGFRDAVVWRGVPGAHTRAPAFDWEAPDGSTVRAQYLPWGYGNGVGLPPDAASLVRRVELFCQRAGSAAGADGDPVLWMHGTDHRHPLPALSAMIAEANELQHEFRFVISTLPEYVREQRASTTPPTTWRGELRSGARANLLMGVTSNRVDVKQAVARAERLLEIYAEPLSALFRPAEAWPAAFLARAWHRVVLNSAHDSICACSHDDVVLAVLDRFAEASAIAEGLVERTKIDAYRRGAPALVDAPLGSAIIVNPSARSRDGLVELRVPAGQTLEGTQDLWEFPARLPFVTRTGTGAMEWLDVIDDQLGDVHAITIDDKADRIDIDLIVDQRRFGLLDPSPVREQLAALTTEFPDKPVHFFYVGQPEHRVLARAASVPGFGWSTWKPGPITVDPVTVDGDERGMSNSLITVRVDDDGSLTVNGHPGLGLLVDDGDRGDTYNFCPVGDGSHVAGLHDVTVTAIESGPLRARLRATGTARWPARTLGDARVGEVEADVHVVVEVRAGEDLVHVETELDNVWRDHRVRAWFELPERAKHSSAECAFGITDRGLEAEGGPSEPALPTGPSRRFVSAGGLTVVHEGLNEYELVEIERGDDGEPAAKVLALTLLRATGMLSRPPMPSRPLPAGPMDPAEGAQLQGHQRLRYAIHVGDRNAYDLVEDAFVPLLVAGSKLADEPDTSTVGAPVADQGSLLHVSGAQVSSLRRLPDSPDIIEVRLFNPTGEPTTVHIEGRRGTRVDLLGNPIGHFPGTCELGPHQIGTIRLDVAAH